MPDFSGVFKLLKTSADRLKESAGSILGLITALLTLGSEHVVSIKVFACPCIEEDIEGYINRGKMMSTGIFLKTMLRIMFRALLAPVAWIVISLLDGKYYACAMTFHPYIQTCETVYENFEEATFSVEYHLHRAESQETGLMLIASCFVVGSLLFIIVRCYAKHTYWQMTYRNLTMEYEREKFIEEAKKKIKEDAKNNTGILLKNPLTLTKPDWDCVSSLQETKGSEYSPLQEWVANKKPRRGNIIWTNTNLNY